MKDKVAKIACKLEKLDSEQLKLVRRWLDELEGRNRKEAYRLMQLVMAGEITNEEALAALDIKHDEGR
jgi:uncharacterized protein YaaN involved in tellurite resistance